MLMEINVRALGEPKYNANRIESSDPLEAFIGKIRNIIFTEKGSCIADISFGLGIERLLFDLNVSEKQLSDEFRDQLVRYAPEEYREFDVKLITKFFKGTLRDIAVIDVIIDSQSVMQIEAR
jgi:hypothetical protein